MKTHEARKGKGQVILFTARLISLKNYFINKFAEFVILNILN